MSYCSNQLSMVLITLALTTRRWKAPTTSWVMVSWILKSQIRRSAAPMAV